MSKITSFTISGEFSEEATIALANFLNCPEDKEKLNYIFTNLEKVVIDFLGQQLVDSGISKEEVDNILKARLISSYGLT